MKNLKFINVMCNKLAALPDEICALTSLYRLGAKSNQLKELPADFGSLVNLVELFLTDNCLTRFPESLQHCTALVKLQVRSILTGLTPSASLMRSSTVHTRTEEGTKHSHRRSAHLL